METLQIPFSIRFLKEQKNIESAIKNNLKDPGPYTIPDTWDQESNIGDDSVLFIDSDTPDSASNISEHTRPLSPLCGKWLSKVSVQTFVVLMFFWKCAMCFSLRPNFLAVSTY